MSIPRGYGPRPATGVRRVARRAGQRTVTVVRTVAWSISVVRTVKRTS